MKLLRAYDIELPKLKDLIIESFEYELTDTFFQLFEDSIVNKGKLQAKVDVLKTPTLVQMNFIIDGFVELTCDRSLDLFDYHIISDKKLIFKFGEVEGEISDEIIGVSKDVVKINIAQYLYEFIGIEIPMRKLHPKFQNKTNEEDSSETELIYTTSKNEETSNTIDEPIDPRWLALEKLKSKNNLN
jgi:uncharacterized metal-binding protein YceD (DUF177 family)